MYLCVNFCMFAYYVILNKPARKFTPISDNGINKILALPHGRAGCVWNEESLGIHQKFLGIGEV